MNGSIVERKYRAIGLNALIRRVRTAQSTRQMTANTATTKMVATRTTSRIESKAGTRRYCSVGDIPSALTRNANLSTASSICFDVGLPAP